MDFVRERIKSKNLVAICEEVGHFISHTDLLIDLCTAVVP